MARLSRALLLASGLLAGTASAAAVSSTSSAEAATATGTTNATQEDGLNSLMVKAGKLYFGTATDVYNMADTQYQAIVTNKNMFGMITAENSMKWASTEANAGKFTYANAEEVVDQAKANGQKMRCHNLVWYNQLPTWGAFPPSLARSLAPRCLSS
jgi:endo-1,4-beta-xylanase